MTSPKADTLLQISKALKTPFIIDGTMDNDNHNLFNYDGMNIDLVYRTLAWKLRFKDTEQTPCFISAFPPRVFANCSQIDWNEPIV